MLLENVRNYTEERVIDYVINIFAPDSGVSDRKYLEDVACIALNQLKPKYYRDSISLHYFTSTKEELELRKNIEDAVKMAAQIASEDPREEASRPV